MNLQVRSDNKHRCYSMEKYSTRARLSGTAADLYLLLPAAAFSSTLSLPVHHQYQPWEDSHILLQTPKGQGDAFKTDMRVNQAVIFFKKPSFTSFLADITGTGFHLPN